MKKTKRVQKWTQANIKLKNNSSKKKAIHLIVDFWGVQIKENKKELKKLLREAAKKANNTPLEFIAHKFEPQGITAVLLLAESHIAVHSWPELDYVAIDIFTCGENTQPEKALIYLKNILKPQKIKIRKILRLKK